MSTAAIPDRFTALADEGALRAAVVAVQEHGFSVEVAGDLDAARQVVLARIPAGSSVMTNTSVTLDRTGIAEAVNGGGGRREPARNAVFALDFATQAPQPAAGGRPRAGRLRAAQPGREDPGDPRRTARPDPRRPHRPARRLLTAEPARSARRTRRWPCDA
jgi:hypothetical protein